MDAQIRQILEWSGNPIIAHDDFSAFLKGYLEKTGSPFDLESVNAKRLLTIFGNSHFLTRFLIQNPKEADQLITSPFLETDKSAANHEEDLQMLFPDFKSFDPKTFGQKILYYKYQEYLRFTVKDLSQTAGQETILKEISALARAIVSTCLNYLLATSANGDEKRCGFSVIGMGKLGGQELNYSSDIDIQYLYEKDSEFDPAHLSHHEYFVKISEKLSRLISNPCDEGFLYRVDLNLRPEGKSGTLANSLGALETYYETFGEEWERQALIKATPLAGDLELGNRFKSLIEPFVWRKSLDLQVIERMKEMKKKVHDSVRKNHQEFHVKLDEGGIREVEFFVQTLQLLYGGKHLSLRTPSTLEGLEALAKLDLIKTADAHQLKEAYLFLRQTEHRLQMVDERQTHTIPANVEAQRSLARRMGYFEEDPEDAREHFLDELTRYTTMVKTTFKNLFE